MLKIAADLGYSETAFATPREDGDYDVRYFSPEAEVPFCGHATIATGVALAERDGAGRASSTRWPERSPCDTGERGSVTATLTSIVPHVEDVPDDTARQRAPRAALVAATNSTRHSRRGSASSAPAT